MNGRCETYTVTQQSFSGNSKQDCNNGIPMNCEVEFCFFVAKEKRRVPCPTVRLFGVTN